MMLNIMKKIFKAALRTDQMIKGDAILQKTRSEQDEIILSLFHNLMEMLGNFYLITLHFGDLTMEQIANTNFMVYIVNSYCLLRKAKKFWLDDCTDKKIKAGIESAISISMNLCTQVLAQVVGQGIVNRINLHSKNYAMVQNKLGLTLKQFILTITGNAEMSKDVLHKQINFICSSESDDMELSLYRGKNYAPIIMKHICRENINLKNAIQSFEERFVGTPDKDFLSMIIDSMMKGRQVHVKKVHGTKQTQILKDQEKDGDSLPGTKMLLSKQDKENVMNIFEMFSGEYNRQLIEKFYLQNNKEFESTLDMFLTGAIPKDQNDELHVIIEDNKKDTTGNWVDTTAD
jgi:hypothetical protein